jgi:hypothetical protein
MAPSDLDHIAARVEGGSGFDVSPGAIAPRPDPELEALLGALGAADVPALRARLAAERDPFLAHTWLRALRGIGGAEAGAAVADYAARLREQDPWAGAFPGAGELLALVGG